MTALIFQKYATVLPAGAVRDYLIYNKLKEAIGRTRDTARREILIAKYVPMISQPKIQQHNIGAALHTKELKPWKTSSGFYYNSIE